MNPDAPFRALRAHEVSNSVESRLETLDRAALTPGELVVRTCWAGVNFKDSLAVTGRAKVLASLPRIPGIEFVGEVAASDDPAFRVGDSVLVHGFETGISFDGGFSEVVRVPAAHAMHVPPGLTPREAAVIGVPGFTVAMALDRFEAQGLRPDNGPVAVSGAGGAVGLFALAILARAGYRTAALTRRAEARDMLCAVGATEVVLTSECTGSRPLENPRFAAAIDNVGGDTLSWLLRSLKSKGQLASVGNASGIAFTSNVLPFILREAQMFGVVANASWPVRRRLWQRLVQEWKPDLAALAPYVHEIRLDELPAHCERQVSGQTSGRTLIVFP